MSDALTRRKFLKLCVAAGAGVLVAPVTCAVAGESAPIRFGMHGFDEEEFGEETIIQKAMNILHRRFRDLDVLENTYDVAKTRHFRTFAWEKSNLASHPKYGKWDLLKYQIRILRSPHDDNDAELEFPRVQIHAFHSKSDTWAFVKGDDVCSVVVRYNEANDRSRQSGEFVINLNRWQLGAKGYGSDPEVWASVIAHEMLHNLGHLHDNGQYGDDIQINAFDHALYCDGDYKRGKDIPGFT